MEWRADDFWWLVRTLITTCPYVEDGAAPPACERVGAAGRKICTVHQLIADVDTLGCLLAVRRRRAVLLAQEMTWGAPYQAPPIPAPTPARLRGGPSYSG